MAKKRLFKFALVLSLAYANLGIASGKDISTFPNLRWNPPIRSVAGDSISVYPVHDFTTLVKHKGGTIPGMRTVALASAFQDSSGDGGDENDPDFLDCLEECVESIIEDPIGLGITCYTSPQACLLYLFAIGSGAEICGFLCLANTNVP